jgi:hypothetical protein
VTTGAGAACPCTVAYEVLRAWATARPRARCGPPGALVLLRRGLAGWLREWPRLVSAPDPPATPRAGVVQGSRPDQALAAILASMIEQSRQEHAQ